MLSPIRNEHVQINLDMPRGQSHSVFEHVQHYDNGHLDREIRSRSRPHPRRRISPLPEGSEIGFGRFLLVDGQLFPSLIRGGLPTILKGDDDKRVFEDSTHLLSLAKSR